ncbi:hypothetical protein C2E23DRAFT_802922 [Lenzites betulinus]|nr:hypothetical protein C2E23DRAFT_802922 [Lenzites betulinus]
MDTVIRRDSALRRTRSRLWVFNFMIWPLALGDDPEMHGPSREGREMLSRDGQAVRTPSCCIRWKKQSPRFDATLAIDRLSQIVLDVLLARVSLPRTSSMGAGGWRARKRRLCYIVLGPSSKDRPVQPRRRTAPACRSGVANLCCGINGYASAGGEAGVRSRFTLSETRRLVAGGPCMGNVRP